MMIQGNNGTVYIRGTADEWLDPESISIRPQQDGSLLVEFVCQDIEPYYENETPYVCVAHVPDADCCVRLPVDTFDTTYSPNVGPGIDHGIVFAVTGSRYTVYR